MAGRISHIHTQVRTQMLTPSVQARCFAVMTFILVMTSFTSAEARVFDFKSERFATYFGGTYGTTNLRATPYDISSGNGVSVDKKSLTGASGEVGFILAGEKLSLKIGVEVLVPQHQTAITGNNAAGTNYFSLDSQTLAYVPEVAVEYLAYRDATSHAMLGFGFGYAFVTLQNKYAMTAAGQAALGVGSYTESAHAQTMAAQIYGGYEAIFTDTVTASFKAGYRYLPVTSLKGTQNASAITGSQSDGSVLVNMDGGDRRLDLSGAFVGVSFNFYL